MEKLLIPAELKAKVRAGIGESPQLSCEEYQAERARWLNDLAGDLPGKYCAKCKSRGYTTEVRGTALVRVECSCMAKRRSMERIRKSGLGDMLERYTFSTYQTPHRWQRDAVEMAQRYLRDLSGRWFVAAGAVGSGKTHLCTALCGELLNAGMEVRYMLWRDQGGRIKAAVNDSAEYARLLDPLKMVRVLYIDDFFKAGPKGVSDGDIHLAFELLNSRYNDRKLVTILSTERTVDEILSIDEAVGSRIYERSEGYYLHFSGLNKNWRLRK